MQKKKRGRPKKHQETAQEEQKHGEDDENSKEVGLEDLLSMQHRTAAKTAQKAGGDVYPWLPRYSEK